MPSGREIHSIKPYHPPFLDRTVLEAMRAPPERADDYGDALSSDDEGGGGGRADAPQPTVGAFPGGRVEYGSGSGSGSTYY
jgi:hypothetical protein